jgi:uncharacterized protein (TIGR02231 family)
MHPTIAPLALSLLALALAAPALAGDIDAASKIDQVTVFPDAASVRRVAKIDLPSGETMLRFKDLPIALDPASLRVEGEGSGKITIGAVETQVTPGEDRPVENDPIDAKLAALRDEREGWQSTIDALQAKRAMIMRFSTSGPDKLGGDGKALDIGQWGSAWDAVAAGLAKVGDELRPALAKARDLDEQIKALQAERQRPPTALGPRRVATVTLNADSATAATIRLSYRVGGANWQPLYDAALSTGGDHTMTFSRRAALAQRTGEDWTDVALSVSTVRAAHATDAPVVAPQKIDFFEVLAQARGPVAAAAPMMDAKESARSNAMKAMKLSPMDSVTMPAMAADEGVAQVEANGWNAEFKVPGLISLPGNGAKKSFLLSRATMQPSVLIKIAPSLDETAYLEAHVTNADEAPILPGASTLHRDNSYIGEARLAFVAPGDSFDIGFGADDRVKVTRAPVNRKENEPTWYNQSKVETREFKTIVKNLHDFPIKARLVDRLPYSENAAILVDVLPATTPPTEKQVGDKRGVMSWSFDLAPGETKEIHLAYRMKWPADREVSFADTP